MDWLINMPGTVITLRQLLSLFANVSISSVTISIRSSSCCQSPARSLTMRTMRGERTSVRFAKMSDNKMAKETHSLPDDDATLQKKAPNLIDHCGPFADKARPYSVQRLQIQLLVGLGWNKASRRSLHGLGHSMSISKVILVPLSKRLRICRRNLLHIVAKRRKLTSNVMCCHPRFDANQAGWEVRKP